jgi:subtilase family serine protease
VAPPEFPQAIEYLSVHHLANAISISDDTAESTYSRGFEEIHAQDPGELTAAANGIPVLLAAGDCDAAQHLAVGGGCHPGLITTKRATGAGDDSPWVTAVGGSIPHLSPTGKRLGPDPVWNQRQGEGAGFSAVYTRPSYQDSVAAITRSNWRSVPDITMDASGGTLESAPLLAGVLALATQLNHGKNVGPINNALYHVLGPAGLKDGIADVVSGNNTLTKNGKVLVRGFTAARGSTWPAAGAPSGLTRSPPPWPGLPRQPTKTPPCAPRPRRRWSGWSTGSSSAGPTSAGEAQRC